MDLGVAVDLAGAGHEEPRLVVPGQLEQAPGALAARGQGLERAARGRPAARPGWPGCTRRRSVSSDRELDLLR